MRLHRGRYRADLHDKRLSLALRLTQAERDIIEPTDPCPLLSVADFHVLVVLLGKAQRIKKPLLQFDTIYELLTLLKWPRSGSYYERATDALDRLGRMTLTHHQWYEPRKRKVPRKPSEKTHDIGIELDWALLRWEEKYGDKQKPRPRQVEYLAKTGRPYRRYRGGGKHIEKTFEKILRYEIRKDGSVVVWFYEDFLKANDRYFILVDPDEIRALRYPTAVNLRLLLSAFGGEVRQDLMGLADKIGVAARYDSEAKMKIENAVRRVEDICGSRCDLTFEFGVYGDPVVVITETDRKASGKAKRRLQKITKMQQMKIKSAAKLQGFDDPSLSWDQRRT